MVTYGSQNPFPSVLFSEHVDPANPDAGTQRLFVDTDHVLKLIDSAGTVTTFGAAGSVATDAIWDAAGNSVQGTGANTAAKLTLGAAGTVVRSTGSTNAYAYPPGYEFDYVEWTSNVAITATTDATQQTVVSGNAIAYDGSTVVFIDCMVPEADAPAGSGAYFVFGLWDGSTHLGNWISQNNAAAAEVNPRRMARRLTPSAATHTYHLKAHVSTGTGNARAAAGGVATLFPGYIRITKV